MDAQLAFYGQEPVLRGWCPYCRTTTIIAGIESLCCGTIPDVIKITDLRRPVTTGKSRRKAKLPVEERFRILQWQEYTCFWCGHTFGSSYKRRRSNHQLDQGVLTIEWDHKIPYVYSQDGRPENIVASCQLCNGFKGSHYFDSTKDGKTFLKERWIKYAVQITKEAPIVWKVSPLL